jgi:hypothetical protein
MSAAALRLLGHSGLRIIRSRHRFSAVLQAGAGFVSLRLAAGGAPSSCCERARATEMRGRLPEASKYSFSLLYRDESSRRQLRISVALSGGASIPN